MSSNPSTETGADRSLDTALRPAAWDEYIGQEQVKKNLRILLTAARQRSQQPEHVLFYGPPGLGKTTLAHLITKEIGANIKVTSGPAIEKVGDLASILTNLTPGDVLFIDEIHRLGKPIEEALYPAMEQGTLDIIIGKGPSARTIQLELPPFTIIAATTRVALLSAPMRSRFSGGTFRLEFYTTEELEAIIRRSAAILGIAVSDTACREIARRSRYTPRVANYLLKRCRDYAQVSERDVDDDAVRSALELLEIDSKGLSAVDRRLLEILAVKFGGGPVGVGTLATALHEEPSTIEEVHEPYLIQIGFLERTPRGRVATPHAYEHIGHQPPKDGQNRFNL